MKQAPTDITQNAKQFQQDWNASVELNFDQNAQPPKTRGEKIFNGLSWALFGWLANATVSIQLADTLENRFRPIYKWGGNAIAESFLFRPFFKNKPEEGQKLAHSLFSVIALLPGGYSVLLPIKFMEDRKVELVKTFDRWFGPKNPDDNTKELTDARHSYLEAAPKLNWGDMIKGRTLPVVGIVATHFAFASDKTNIVNLMTGKDTFKGFNHHIGATGNRIYDTVKQSRFESVRNMANTVEKRLDKGIQKHMQLHAKEDPKRLDAYKVQRADGSSRTLTGEDRLRGYLSNISIDLLYSAIVAVETFVLGHLSAFKREGKDVQRLDASGHPVVEKRKFHLESADTQETQAANIPSTKLQEAQYEQRLVNAPQLQQGA